MPGRLGLGRHHEGDGAHQPHEQARLDPGSAGATGEGRDVAGGLRCGVGGARRARRHRRGHRGDRCSGSGRGRDRGSDIARTRALTVPRLGSGPSRVKGQESIRESYQWSPCATQPTDAVGLGPASPDPAAWSSSSAASVAMGVDAAPATTPVVRGPSQSLNSRQQPPSPFWQRKDSTQWTYQWSPCATHPTDSVGLGPAAPDPAVWSSST